MDVNGCWPNLIYFALSLPAISSPLYVHVCSLQQKHQAVEKEINGRGAHFRFTCQAGERLRKEGHYAAKGIGTKVVALQDKWKKLNELATSRTTRLEEAVQYQQVRHLWLHYHCYIYRCKQPGCKNSLLKSLLCL